MGCKAAISVRTAPVNGWTFKATLQLRTASQAGQPAACRAERAQPLGQLVEVGACSDHRLHHCNPVTLTSRMHGRAVNSACSQDCQRPCLNKV